MMNVIDFNKSLEKKKKSQITKEPQASITKHSHNNKDLSFDLSQIDQEIFEHYLTEFPCFHNYHGPITPQELFYASERGKLTENQLIILSFIFEILSDYDFGFLISDVFDILGKDDQSAFIKIIASHSFLTSHG